MEELQKVAETRHLVDMLDYVVGGAAQGEEYRGRIPWGGMKVTLEHIGRRLLELEHLLRDSSSAESVPPYIPPVARREPQDGQGAEASAGSGIAGRIQMAPRAGRRGYSREISSGESIGAQETIRAE